MVLSIAKSGILKSITKDLSQVNGVKAIVLGGSHATGMATDTSDLDIGIYYHAESPFQIADIQRVVEKYHTGGVPVVTDFYAWGPWVNGGAWIETEVGDIDFVYKNIDQLQATIENAQAGIWENHYEQQPPYGFSSIIYLAETKCCEVLYDPENVLSPLKKCVEVYPPKLKSSIVQQCLWAAEFTIWQARSFAEKADMYNNVGCFTRALHNIVSALFALNEIYPMGDKRAIDILDRANLKPERFAEKVNTILSASSVQLLQSFDAVKQLFDETVVFAGVMYVPYFKL